MDGSFVAATFMKLMGALPLTLELWALSVMLGGGVAAGVTWMRVSGIKPLTLLARAYVAVFRGTPLLIQLFLVYYGLASIPAVRHSVFWPFLRDPADARPCSTRPYCEGHAQALWRARSPEGGFRHRQ